MRKLLFLLLFLLFAGFDSVVAQPDVQLWLAQPDVSDFPVVRINVLSADFRSTPLADLSDLRLRENGTPVPDFEIKTVPVGIDVVFVIDTDESIHLVDDNSELTRYQKIQESITRYATRFMSPGGLDRVSIVVPDKDHENGRFLIEDATEPTAVTEAVSNYTPESSSTTPLHAMMTLAMEHAVQLQVAGRFQAVLLFSDASQLNQQLDYPSLLALAQRANNLPVFAAILGGQATLDEIENVNRFTEPTRAFYVHMPRPADADPIYLIWQRQGNQPQIEYRSLQTRSGSYPITVNLGQVTASTVLELTIEPPQVAIQLEDNTVRRVGTAVDTPLTSLEPVRQPVPVMVSWPDGLPRQLVTVAFFVNDQPVFSPQLPELNEDGRLVLTWDIRNLDAGAYELVAEVTDELGMAAASEPVILTVAVVRPSPPTPTPAATAVPAT
ncbi:MAG TPA: vWA domain-containing protein, partial [Anaerolineae bacterium]